MNRLGDTYRTLAPYMGERRETEALQDPKPLLTQEQQEHDVLNRLEDLKREMKEIRAIKTKLQSRKYRANLANEHKERARIAVSSAIRDGSLNAAPCEICGEIKTEAHHEDYAKPLEVRWLCKPCHAKDHRGTHCALGHEWTPENTYVLPSGKRRYCLECRRIDYQRRYTRASDIKALCSENEGFRKRIAELEAVLGECRDYFENAADVKDGSYGEPAPNREMAILIAVDEVLG